MKNPISMINCELEIRVEEKGVRLNASLNVSDICAKIDTTATLGIRLGEIFNIDTGKNQFG